MNALVLDGFEIDSEPGIRIEKELAALLEGRGFTIDHIRLSEKEFAHCVSCFGCWVRTPGICVLDDFGRDISSFIMDSSLVIYVTPITFGCYSSVLKKALDRTIPILLPFFTKIDGETHHRPRYESYPSILAIGVENSSGGADIFRELAARNAINMHAPSHAALIVREEEPVEQLRKMLEKTIEGLGVEV